MHQRAKNPNFHYPVESVFTVLTVATFVAVQYHVMEPYMVRARL